MSAFAQRRAQDVQKLKELEVRSSTRIRIVRVSGQPPNEVGIEMHLKTAPSKHYPSVVQEVTKLTISLPSRYPLDPPAASIITPIFHPNVYASGLICLGMKWLPSLSLDHLVRRIAQIVTFDPAILNEESPANRDALAWYRQAQRAHQAAFPTDVLVLSVPESQMESQKKMSWTNIPSESAKTLVQCPACASKLSLPTGKRGRVKCPKCNVVFEAMT